MSRADAALERYARERPRFERAGKQVVELMKEILAPTGIAPTLSYRAKDLASFRQKIQLKGYADPWAETTDKVGVRAVVQRASHVDDIASAISADARLEIWNITDKRAALDDATMAYSGLHLDVYAPAEEEDRERISCEIQIRTIAQDAWSVVSHKLVYKPDVPLPTQDRRSIMRLVALVELFDGEVERVMEKVQTLVPERRAQDPFRLLEIVSAQYRLFDSSPGNHDLSLLVLHAVAESLESDGVADYADVLDRYVEQNRPALTELFEDFGPASALSTSADYVLWSQPESLALLECLEHRPAWLRQAWLEAGLSMQWLRPLAAAAGADLDHD